MDLMQTLLDMNSNDFVQRYSGTYVKYDGKPFYIGNLSKTKAKIVAAVQDLSMPILDRAEKVMELDVRLLDISRPKVQWYFKRYKGALIPFLLEYSFQRQWKRGVCEGNTTIYAPHKSFTLKAYWPEVVLKRNTVSLPGLSRENLKSLRLGVPQIVQDSWLFTGRNIFYRSAVIAECVAYSHTDMTYAFAIKKGPVDLYHDDMVELLLPEVRHQITFEGKNANLSF